MVAKRLKRRLARDRKKVVRFIAMLDLSRQYGQPVRNVEAMFAAEVEAVGAYPFNRSPIGRDMNLAECRAVGFLGHGDAHAEACRPEAFDASRYGNGAIVTFPPERT